jgi:LPXTG-motif cell wall-anchored protein
LSQFTTAPTVNFYNTSTEVTDFFTNINTLRPAIIWMPDNWSRPSAVEDIFTAKAEVIADFVNSGGGLFANMGRYGWLTALLPSATYNDGGCNGGPEATSDGTTDFGLTNEMVAACWHGYFTGNVGTLKTLVDYPYPSVTDTRKAVSIGGGSVSLPSSFTLAISPTSPNAGEDLIITATAQTLAGVPQAGVVVTMTVSTGPDAGQTFAATTDASGVATIIVRTNSTGSATYTATATVNGVLKTVSTTVSWNPPTTTTAGPTTTTTEPATTTTEAEAPTTTVESSTTTAETTTTQQVPPATQAEAPQTTQAEVQTVDGQWTAPQNLDQTTTTVHDHSTHDHGPRLPKTGSSAYFTLIIGFGLICSGILLIQRKRYLR